MASSYITISLSYLKKKVIVLFSIILFAPTITASENQFKLDGRVLELDSSNFDAAISKFDYVFVDFYAPWCGHCKRLAPELDKAAPVLAGLKPPIVVAKIDADKYRNIASKYDIDGFPTLKIFTHGVATEYFGSRKADLLIQFLRKFSAPDVVLLNSDPAIRDFVEAAGSNFPIFIGFGLNESIISALAVEYKKKAWFSVARDFSDDVMSSYGFDKVPALVATNPAYNEKNIFYGPFEETFLEDFVKQSFLPLVLPINQDSLKLLKDDTRKIIITILGDETDENSKRIVKVLKSAAAANRDLIFGYVGSKQWGEFVESFQIYKKTPLPQMVVWDGDEEYYTVNGLESIDEADMGTQVSRFLEGYREGNVIQKRISGPSFFSVFGFQIALISLFVVLVMVMILFITKEEPLTVGTHHPSDGGSSSTSQQETRESRRTTEKED